MAISILERAGFKINFSKSVILPTQVIDYLGYTLDARRQCVCIQKSKLVKCKLTLKGLSLLNLVSRKLMEQLLGFFNFIFTIIPLARLFIRVWYDQPRLHISDSSRIFFNRKSFRLTQGRNFRQNFCFSLDFGGSAFALFCQYDSSVSCWLFRQGLFF